MEFISWKHINRSVAAMVCLGLLFCFGLEAANAQPLMKMQGVSAKPTIITVTLGKTLKVLIPGQYPKTNARLVTVQTKRGERSLPIKGIGVTVGDTDQKRTGRYFTFETSATNPASPGMYQLEYYDARSKRWQAVPLTSVQIKVVPAPKAVTDRAKAVTGPSIAARQLAVPAQEGETQPEEGEAPPEETETPSGPTGPDFAFESCEVRCNKGGGYSTQLCQQEGYKDYFMFLVTSTLRNAGDVPISIEEGWKVWSATHQSGNSAPVPVGWADYQVAKAGGIYLTPGSAVPGSNGSTVYAIKNLAAGTHRVVLTADPDNHIAETDEANNTSECVWDVVAAPPPPPYDLTITHLSVSPQSGPPGTDFKFTVTLKNIGGDYFDVISTSCQPGTNFNKLNLEADETVTRTYSIPGTPTPGEKTITCTASGNSSEQDKSNNSMSATFTVTAP